MCKKSKNIKVVDTYLIMIHHNDTRSSLKVCHCQCDYDYIDMLTKQKEFCFISHKEVNIFVFPSFPSIYLKPLCFIDKEGAIHFFDRGNQYGEE